MSNFQLFRASYFFQNAPTALSSDVINSNGKANQKTAPFPAPRQNAPPMSPTSGDSFDDSTSSASNPESTPREDHHTNSDTESNNPQTPGLDPFQADDNTYATITKTQPRQNPDSTSETSSSSSNNSESGGYNAGGTFFPPIPYHNPPAYANVPLPIASQNRQVIIEIGCFFTSIMEKITQSSMLTEF